MIARTFAFISLASALSACGPSEQELLEAQEAELASQAALAQKVLPLDTEPLFTRDGKLSVRLPLDLLAQPFEHAIMAASSDGNLRFFLDELPQPMLNAVGPLKDELIGLGWTVLSEKHYQQAIALRFEVGGGANHQGRAVWLMERAYLDSEGKQKVRTLRCESQARDAYLDRLGLALRAICQGVQTHGDAPLEDGVAPGQPAPAEGASPAVEQAPSQPSAPARP